MSESTTDGGEPITGAEITNPKDLIDAFRRSAEYEQGFMEYWKSQEAEGSTALKTLREIQADKVMEKEAFRKRLCGRFEESGSDIFKVSFFNFALDTANFRYDPTEYSSEAAGAIYAYTESAKKLLIVAREGDADLIREANEYRMNCHIKVAGALISDGIVDNEKFGRLFGRLILVVRNLDTRESASESDFARARRMVGI